MSNEEINIGDLVLYWNEHLVDNYKDIYMVVHKADRNNYYLYPIRVLNPIDDYDVNYTPWDTLTNISNARAMFLKVFGKVE